MTPRDLWISACFVSLVLILGTSHEAAAQNLLFKVPPVKIPLNIKDQQITILASAYITRTAGERGVNVVKLVLTADLSDLQQNMTGLLKSELDTDDRCGDHIAIQRATLTPQEPSGLVLVQLHYERRACLKVLGKQQTSKLVSGDAAIHMKLTPVVDNNNTKLRLMGEVGAIEADGSLGELLRAGPLGDALREKIRNSVQNALQKGADLGATLPSSVQPYATIQNAQFRNDGSGRIEAVLTGEFRISNEQLQLLASEVKNRAGLK